MPVDNQLYDTLAGSWWDESGVLSTLQGLNPARFGYMRRILTGELGMDLQRRRTLNVGCGGGLLAEEFVRLGCTVTGIDPSAKSLEAARAHARQEGLAIEYGQGVGESLPFPDGAFEIVYCCDTLEHVEDLDKVLGEIARVLGPGGVFLYDTLNRTFRSWLIMIKVLQDWDSTSLMPPNLHAWKSFISPASCSPGWPPMVLRIRDTPASRQGRGSWIRPSAPCGRGNGRDRLSRSLRQGWRCRSRLSVLYAGWARKR